MSNVLFITFFFLPHFLPNLILANFYPHLFETAAHATSQGSETPLEESVIYPLLHTVHDLIDTHNRLVLLWLMGERVRPSHLESTAHLCILEKSIMIFLSYRSLLVSPCRTGHTQHPWENVHGCFKSSGLSQPGHRPADGMMRCSDTFVSIYRIVLLLILLHTMFKNVFTQGNYLIVY